MSKYINAVGQAYKQIQEKKVIDAESIDGSTVADVDASIQEAKFVIPEEIPANERTAFHGAAAAAAKAGKKSFDFGGKSHPVTMAKDTAHKIADDTQKEMSSKEKMKKGLYNDTQKEGMYKDMDTEKSEPNPRTDDKVKADAKKRKGTKDEITVNPKMEKETGSSMEQKESTIREKLVNVLSEKRDDHYKSATKPETMDDKLKGKGAKDMVDQPTEIDDTEKKGHDDSVKAGRAGPAQAKPRSGGDNVKKGDTKIVPGGTPTKNLTKTMEAYASMYEKIDHHDFPKGQKPHPAVVKHAKEFDAMDVFHEYHKDGHSVQTHGGDEYIAYHHVDNKGKHQGHYLHDHETRGGDETPPKSEIKKALPNSPSHVHTAIHKQIHRDVHGDLDDYRG